MRLRANPQNQHRRKALARTLYRKAAPRRDAPSRIKPLGAEAAERVVALTLGEPFGATADWTGALMAKAAGLSMSSVQRIRTGGSYCSDATNLR